MQRKIPLKRKTPLKRTALVRKASKPIKRTARIKQESNKRTKEKALYWPERAIHLVNYPLCQASLEGCWRQSEEIHHKKGKIGKLLYDRRFFLATCRHCHDWIEAHPKEAKALGLSVSRLAKA